MSAGIWPTYNAVWRWHFYAALLCVPFVLWLAMTGSIYLFKPQIEALIDRPYATVIAADAPRAAAAAHAAAAVRAVPGSVLHRYQLPETPTQAVQVIVGRGGAETRVYLHPASLAVLKTVDEDSRLMRIVFRLHGDLLIGTPGSWLVELAASWAIVMVISGLFLWWPRGSGLAGVVYPRLRGSSRMVWRDLHAVVGLWVSVGALFLLISGLPWAKSWGAYLKAVRSVAEGQPVRQDWSFGRADELRARATADAGTRAMLGGHAEHGGMTMAHPAGSYAPLDIIVATLRPMALAPPVLVAPPTGIGAPWTAKSDAANRPLRTDLTLDGRTGTVLTRKDFAQRRLIDRLVGWGVAIHEGRAFGWLNQLINLMTAIGLATLSVSGVVMWWRRRPRGMLGAPPALALPALAKGFALVLIAPGLALPLFGLSLAVVLLIDRLILDGLPAIRAWLGLRPRATVSR